MVGDFVLKFKVVKCVGLKRPDAPNKKPDPYVIVEIEGSAFSTTAKEGSTDPIFNETFTSDVSMEFLKHGSIVLRVCHLMGGESGAVLMGENKINIARIMDGLNNITLHGQDRKTTVGTLVLHVEKKEVMSVLHQRASDLVAISQGTYSPPVVAKRPKRLSSARSPDPPSPNAMISTRKLISPTAKVTKIYQSTAAPEASPSSKRTTSLSPSSRQTKTAKKTPLNSTTASPQPKASGGGLVGGVIGLLKLPIKLGVVAAASLLAISFVPEEKYSSNLTKFAKESRTKAVENSQHWAEKTKDWATSAGKATGKQTKEVGSSVISLWGKKVTVQPGDTLGKIATQNNTTVARLRKINRLSDQDVVSAGSMIRV
eukprot:CAMPEP_0196578956 /NCGR_PEP_ID=MMETSP1081-20130531/13598_1 /TAXON_ID=36882 /ORGANISM="Pyramimonas amylifera, Strain CCMP720" /LENGTH=370 /DNA_ID=CAMNT_0041898365 /DNA_START=116 /DNA_END=1228 /DNA_ORIENTATION=+